ncbi:hypothetical protein CI109_104146 [Kwoniella shandongensis]|uniref:Uncharacterized protein n=1 Tax=Kwoniella shandongensis TaxID=1734106 RepID=A0A5M6C244_9TREE|nr:uncharacterized protein CI109_002941 [Kwoniella shandongensis]KAA5528781.1 hypothetical protein CI109_002941 [Kwoniella shandongensis]
MYPSSSTTSVSDEVIRRSSLGGLSSSPPSDSDIWGSSNANSNDSNSNSLRKSSLRRRNAPSSHNDSTTSSSNSGDRPNPHRPDLSQRRTSSTPSPHPLSHSTPPTHHTDVLGDISRPALKRVTTETERQVAESSRSGGSESLRGSFDVLRMSTVDEPTGGGEVEVLIHTIKPNESLAGIALIYGIDLATLRKVNKLWASDPIHIRTHLYVPLDACRWNKARETLVRGPGEGQVTLMPKVDKRKTNGLDKGKGKQKEEDHDGPRSHKGNGLNGRLDTPSGVDAEGGWGQSEWTSNDSGEIDGIAQTFLPSTNIAYNRPSVDLSLPPPVESSSMLDQQEDNEPTPRVLDVVRIPSSQLRFFPRPQKPPDPSRASLERDRDESDGGFGDTNRRSSMAIRRNSSGGAEGPSIVHDLSTLPPPLRHSHSHSNAESDSPPKANVKTRAKTTVVRLRPPQPTQPLHSSSKLANRLSSLFTVPPPPPQAPFGTKQGSSVSRPRISLDSSFSSTPRSSAGSRRGSGASSPATLKMREESMEMMTRLREEPGNVGLGIGQGDEGVTRRVGSARMGKKDD